MGSLVVRALSVVGVVVGLTALGLGVASADPLNGKTYGDAVSAIEKYNGTAVVATVSGDQVALDRCIVTSWHTSNFLDASGNNRRSKEYRFNLNCNNPIASPGKPGNSSMSKEGAQAKRDQATAETINTNPAWCEQDEKHMGWCSDICNRTGLCEM